MRKTEKTKKRIGKRIIFLLVLILPLFVIFSSSFAAAAWGKSAPRPPPSSISPYEGWVDSASCNSFSGWAWDANQPNTPINVDVYEGSAKWITILADKSRADLVTAKKGNGAHGFSVNVPVGLLDGRQHRITFKYGGTQSILRGGTVSLGACTANEHQCALLAKNSAGTYDVLMTANGGNNVACSLSCIGTDGKLKAECNKPNLPGWPKPTMAVEYYEKSLGAGYLWQTTLAANCGSKVGTCGPQDKAGLYFKDFIADFSAYVAAPVSSTPLYDGWVDSTDCNSFSGWAWDVNQPNTPINVDVYEGSAKWITILADKSRADLVTAGKGNGVHGFSVNTPVGLLDGKQHRITFKYGGTQSVLNLGTINLICASAPAKTTIKVTTPAALPYTCKSLDFFGTGSPKLGDADYINQYVYAKGPSGGGTAGGWSCTVAKCDLNGDGKIDLTDGTIGSEDVKAGKTEHCYGSLSVAAPASAPYDANKDGKIDCTDYNEVLASYKTNKPASGGVIFNNLGDLTSIIDLTKKAGLNCIGCNPNSKLGDMDGDGEILSNDVLRVSRIAAGTLAKPSNICCIDLYPKGAPDGVINSNDQTIVAGISIGTQPDYVGKTCANPVQQPGCAYNNPACGTNYNCVNNACVLKSGCAYNNPACGANYNCVNNACALKPGCAYNNPACAAGSICTNNECVKTSYTTTLYSIPWRVGGSGRGLFFYSYYSSTGEVSNKIYLNTGDGAGNPFVGCTIPSKGVWHNYVTVLDKQAGTAKLYIDGTYCGSAAYRDPKAEGDFYLSFPGPTISENTAWNGAVDDAVVVNRALSEDEIKSLYNSRLSSSCMNKTGYYCSRGGDWTTSSNQVADGVSGEVGPRKYAPIDYRPDEAGFLDFNCCPANSCWDGFTCVPPNMKYLGKELASGQFIPESLVADDLTLNIKTETKEYACMQRVVKSNNKNYGEANWVALDSLNLEKSESICKSKYPPGPLQEKGWTGTTCCFKPGQYYSETAVCEVRRISGNNQEVCYSKSGPDKLTQIELSKIAGGCWDGIIVPTETRLSSDTRIFVDRMGRFRFCNGTRTDAVFPNKNPMIIAPACMTFNSSEENTDMFFCEPKALNKQSGEWKETVDHVDGNTNINKLLPKTSSLPNGVSAASVGTQYPEQCCPAAHCWNGSKCVTSGSDGEQNILAANSKNFRCLNGKWREFSFKYDWDNERSGACSAETSCYVKQLSGKVGSEAYAAPYMYTSSTPPKCLAGELPNRLDFTYIGDHLCEKGNWTTRTKFVALKLINYTQKQKSDNFVLSCGDYLDVLNVYDFPVAYPAYDNTGKPVSKTDSAEKIFGESEDLKPNKRKYRSHEISECFGQECANNVCVLKLKEGAAEKVIMGVSLNQEIYDYTGQNNNFLSAFKKDIGTGLSLSGCDAPVKEMKRLVAANQPVANTGKYTSCGTQKLWYNPQMRIMLYSKDAFALEAPGLIDFVASPLNALKYIFSKAFTSGQAASAGANEIVSAQNFDTLYYAKSGGREVKGVIEKKLVGPEYDKKSYITMSLEYTGFKDNICSEIQKQTSQDLEFVELPIKCAKGSEKDGGKTSVSVVVLYSEFSEQAVNNLWKELIKIKLDLCSVAVPDGMNECMDAKYCLDRGIRLMADNDAGTFWFPAGYSANAKIVFKSTVKGNTKISYAWQGDNNRVGCNGEILVSTDDINYVSIFKGKNAGAPASLTTDKSFSYMKIKVGKSAGQDCGWVRINEISVSGGTEGLCWQ